jgi:hypothetical protein
LGLDPLHGKALARNLRQGHTVSNDGVVEVSRVVGPRGEFNECISEAALGCGPSQRFSFGGSYFQSKLERLDGPCQLFSVTGALAEIQQRNGEIILC